MRERADDMEDPACRPSDHDDAEEGELVGELVRHSNDEYLPPRKRIREDSLPRQSSDQGEESDDAYVERVEAAIQAQHENEDEIIEARRRRRREILAKYGRGVEASREHDEVPPVDVQHPDQDEDVGMHTAMETENAEPEHNNSVHNDEKEEDKPVSSDAEDIFADTPLDDGTKDVQHQKPAASKGLVDSYDDAEGYYNFQVGEIIQSRYEVFATHGRGVFSSVLRARDLKRLEKGMSKDECPQVAVKVIRANDTMYKAGQTERVILNKLSKSDPDGKKHCIRLLNSFDYRNHLCLVFEPMAMNLRDLTKKYGRGIGLSITAVKIYATQMLVALQHLKQCGVLHADIKPDNILVNDKRTVIKICDFGSAMFSGDNEITPYLVSRFYRSPEVILGLPYDHPMDMWSIGCVIYELFTGQILFKGRSNNEMLKYMMDVKGPFPKKMLKKAEFAFKHFDLSDANMAFAMEESDPVTHQVVKRMISNPQKQTGFSKLLAHQSDNKKKVNQLVDLLERMFALEPDKRITPLDALQHPFIKDQPIKNAFMAQAPRAVHQHT